jgi:hypothetical protein
MRCSRCGAGGIGAHATAFDRYAYTTATHCHAGACSADGDAAPHIHTDLFAHAHGHADRDIDSHLHARPNSYAQACGYASRNKIRLGRARNGEEWRYAGD